MPRRENVQVLGLADLQRAAVWRGQELFSLSSHCTAAQTSSLRDTRTDAQEEDTCKRFLISMPRII